MIGREDVVRVARLARLAQMEADEVSSIMADVDKMLDEAQEPE